MVFSKRKNLLVLGDILICYVALWAALTVRAFSVIEGQLFIKFAITFSAVFFVWIITLYALGLYELLAPRNRISLLRDLLRAVAINTLLGIALFYALYPYHGFTPKTQLLLVAFFAHFLFLVWRHLWVRLFSSRIFAQRIWFLGENRILTQIREDLFRHPHLGFKPISSDHGLQNAQFSDKSQWRPSEGSSNGLRKLTDIIIIPHETLEHSPEKFKAIFICAIADGIPVLTDIDFYETLYGKIPPDHAARPEWLLSNILARQRRVYFGLKRWLDVLVSALSLVVLLLPMLVITAISRMTGIRRPFYGQRRLGYKGKEFVIWKFRTMIEGSDQNGPFEKSRAPGTITTWGGLLRRLRLDELPQLWNVLKGDMSLVGPRPEWMEEVEVLEKHVAHYHLRHLVKPGITGWAQVNFKATSNLEDSREKLRYDLYYVKNLSFAIDVGIILKTIKRIFISEVSFLSPISSSVESSTEGVSTAESSEHDLQTDDQATPDSPSDRCVPTPKILTFPKDAER